MKSNPTPCLLLILLLLPPLAHAIPGRTLSREELRDKIRGAWAGQMIGVAYGAPIEFIRSGSDTPKLASAWLAERD
ncbi:MAG: hypothetical protein WCV99_20300 [Sterolibacterium sp.]|jgi:hypothetical protein